MTIKLLFQSMLTLMPLMLVSCSGDYKNLRRHSEEGPAFGSALTSEDTSIQLITPAAGTTLDQETVAVSWAPVAGATGYYLGVGTTLGKVSTSPWGDLLSRNVGTATSATVEHVPIYGDSIYIRVWAYVNGGWIFKDFSFATAAVTPTKAVLLVPAAGQTIASESIEFQWDSGKGARTYYLGVGTSQDSIAKTPYGDIFHGNIASSLTQTVTGIPLNGARVYVRLWSYLKDHWEFTDYSFLTQPANVFQLKSGTVLDQTAATLESKFQFYRFPTTDYLNWGGLDEKWLRSKSEPGKQFFITPSGDLFRWDGSSKATFPGVSVKVGAVDPSYYVDLDQLINLAVPTDPASIQNEFGFVAPQANYQYNWGGKKEKWLRADKNGAAWYFILPNGDLYRWDRSTPTTFPGISTLAAHLPAFVYLDPQLLLNAPSAEAFAGTTISTVTSAGTGCPDGSVASNISPDLKALTLLFDSFYVSYDPENGEVNTSADCEISLQLNAPSGWQVSIISVDVRGYVDLTETAKAEISTNLSYGGSNEKVSYTHFVDGPVADDFQFRAEAVNESLVWSECGSTETLNIHVKTEVTATQDDIAYLSVDGIDSELHHQVGLVWRRCQ